MALGVFLSSYAPNLATFMFCYSFLFGTGIGLAYTAPMVNGWRWFPNRKGMVSGAVVAGFGAGGFVFNQVREECGNDHVFLMCCFDSFVGNSRTRVLTVQQWCKVLALVKYTYSSSGAIVLCRCRCWYRCFG